jgi:glycosyltransferase involved in cell wall biosynthesis
MVRDMPIDVIPHGIDLAVYRPVERAAARAALGLATDRPVIMTAVPLNNPMKGIRHLGEALFFCDGPDIDCGTLRSIKRRQMVWLSAGRGEAPELPAYVEHVRLEDVGDERLLALAYNAADVHVLPTLVDNLPNVLIEAAACGTPSVAFDRGGVSEAVVADETGWVTPAADVAALAAAIDGCLKLSDDRKQYVRKRCRAYAAQHWNFQLHAQRYEQCFERTIGESAMREAA